MPIYEYECRRCQRRLETMRRLSDPPLSECPECGGELRKLVSAPAFQFKGSGWYVTDYARKGGDTAKGEAGQGGDAKASDAGADKGGEKAGDKAGDKGGDARAAGKGSTPSAPAGGGKAAAGGSSSG